MAPALSLMPLFKHSAIKEVNKKCQIKTRKLAVEINLENGLPLTNPNPKQPGFGKISILDYKSLVVLLVEKSLAGERNAS